MKSIVSKKGQVGLDTAKAVILALMVLGILAFALIVAMGTLNDTNVLTDSSIADNATTDVLNNITTGVSTFFGNATTWFILLGVVVIILIIVIVVVVVQRFGGSRQSM